MELNIIPIGNSEGIILPKALMKRFYLKRGDVLLVSEDDVDLTLSKKEKEIDMSFFAELPSVPEAYGGDTDAYLEVMEAPEDE